MSLAFVKGCIVSVYRLGHEWREVGQIGAVEQAPGCQELGHLALVGLMRVAALDLGVSLRPEGLGKGGPALVQPRVLPALARHEVTEPLVSQFV
jgi:hypothetical protein